MINKPIRILGGGISGLSAAITLADKEYAVELFEKSSYPGGRFIRNFQCLRNFGHNEIDAIDEIGKIGIYLKPYKNLYKIIRYSKSYNFEVSNDKKPIYYLLLRGRSEYSIDSQLAKYATNMGINIFYNKKIESNDITIVASGPSKADSLAYCEVYEDCNISDTGHVFLNKKYSPDGYIYVLPGPIKGEAILVICTTDSSFNFKKLKILLDQFKGEKDILKNIFYKSTQKSSQNCIGSCSLLSKPYVNNKYYVGEAAGLQDVTAGFGIRYAIYSGYFAAQSIIDKSNYNIQISKMFKSQLEFEHKRSIRFSKLTNDDIDKIFQKVNKEFGNKLNLEEYGSIRGMI